MRLSWKPFRRPSSEAEPVGPPPQPTPLGMWPVADPVAERLAREDIRRAHAARIKEEGEMARQDPGWALAQAAERGGEPASTSGLPVPMWDPRPRPGGHWHQDGCHGEQDAYLATDPRAYAGPRPWIRLVHVCGRHCAPTVSGGPISLGRLVAPPYDRRPTACRFCTAPMTPGVAHYCRRPRTS